MNERGEMISELKKKVIPILKESGFKGSFPNFRRVSRDTLNLITFQFDKWGGGFCIEIANGNPQGFTYGGEFIETKNIRPYHLVNRIRLGATDANEDYWFRYDNNNNNYSLTSEDVLNKLPVAEEWFIHNAIII